MADHIYDKSNLIKKFDSILGKTFGEIDNKGLFEKYRKTPLQKGIAGDVIEQCILGYEPDSKQEADLLIFDNGKYIPTELKTTGMVIQENNKGKKKYYVAKEPMSITAVGIYDISEQSFTTSHFWNKLEHMLIVYYHYLFKNNSKVTAYDYRKFPVKGYEFHEFEEEEKKALEKDWQTVHDLISDVIAKHFGERNTAWKKAIKEDYLKARFVLRKSLNYIDLAPKFPPRFRLKQPIVSSIIAKHFGQKLEQLPGRYTYISDIDLKCRELTCLYSGKTFSELAELFSIEKKENKAFAEKIVIKMFGGNAKSLNQIEDFYKFGLIAKTIVLTPSGGRTEDMKLFHIDFSEVIRTEVYDEGKIRAIQFEDSALYSYFADHEFLCIICEEPKKEYYFDERTGKKKAKKHNLSDNRFIGFKRLVFDDEFIEEKVRFLWKDIRDKIINKKLVNVVITTKDGKPIINKSGSVRSAPNFLKASTNDIFVRGSGNNSSEQNKKEMINGIKMIPQYVWIKGKTVVEELEKVSLL